ncbi:hypothetical protein EVAR_41788_1 [Eumeta japonica]|uniref:Uncharacterized protein n=1 Tax=Eumeta variegata TaxID=151549 RepID=A0A4C1VYN5_EUMVA|nr:hypothetical protein EVAR_41788_1 [Eumeta japonica]
MIPTASPGRISTLHKERRGALNKSAPGRRRSDALLAVARALPPPKLFAMFTLHRASLDVQRAAFNEQPVGRVFSGIRVTEEFK